MGAIQAESKTIKMPFRLFLAEVSECHGSTYFVSTHQGALSTEQAEREINHTKSWGNN